MGALVGLSKQQRSHWENAKKPKTKRCKGVIGSFGEHSGSMKEEREYTETGNKRRLTQMSGLFLSKLLLLSSVLLAFTNFCGVIPSFCSQTRTLFGHINILASSPLFFQTWN
uniref:Uncharacterized protein n=1 Tax=Trieres chinensis TaxID=1514140 RepID=A0A7S2A4Q4_TRICV|mmetsp:Transcript_39907/g.81471  ORF Transcript_39907/g.81471 Transcript_39907/m.81471 type:complete len:112 (+) Transcript_39907:171-506(+)